MLADGIRLQLLIGKTLPVPAPRGIVEALDRVEVTHAEAGTSGFQLTFRIERRGPLDPAGGASLTSREFDVFGRVVLVVTLGGTPRVLMDGFVTDQQMVPGDGPGSATLTLTGEDVSQRMDREESTTEHPGQSDAAIVRKILGKYVDLGLVPVVVPPERSRAPGLTEHVPVQRGTDLAHVRALAERHAFVFAVRPGPAPLTNTAYWGPPVRTGPPQRTLSVHLGPHTNVDSIRFRRDAAAPAVVKGLVDDPNANGSVPVSAHESRRPPLAAAPDLDANRGRVRHVLLDPSALDAAGANARAQARTERSASAALTAEGELDAVRYGDVLVPGRLVGLRGAGLPYDGLHYVTQVTHALSRGSYRQRFTLTREGLGTTVRAMQP